MSDTKTDTAGPVRVLSSRWGDGRAHDMDRFLELDGYASLDLAFSGSSHRSVGAVRL